MKLTQKMESEYEHKLGVEMLRFDKLSEDMETLTQRCEEALQKQEDVLRSEITRIKNEHAAVTRRLQLEKEELQTKLSETLRMDEEVCPPFVCLSCCCVCVCVCVLRWGRTRTRMRALIRRKRSLPCDACLRRLPACLPVPACVRTLHCCC